MSERRLIIDNLLVENGSIHLAVRDRLIVSKLDAASYTRFTNHVLPKRDSELCYNDTVKTSKELFGYNTSIFTRRYIYLRTEHNGGSLSDYTGTVNRRHEMAEFNGVTTEQMKCLMWICGLHNPDDGDIRTCAGREMEGNPETTLNELSLEIQQFLNTKQDAKLLRSPPSLLQPEANAVATKKNCTWNTPSPCFRCGGSHWAKECNFINKMCQNCRLVAHKDYCKIFV
ncbi:unnamed protein product [Toxocara canis]|uniref:DUF7083 domain-containing protein n=1 Tax=Toxocara canis TaxID=6265 RepID=A0A183V1Z9_TOXCA|nr:unnamed protein product [Toxocara canis]